MDEARTKAEAVIERLGSSFTFDRFKKMYYSNIDYVTKGSLVPLKPLYDSYIKELNENDQYKNAIAYQTSLNALSRFGGDKLTLQDITDEWCSKFERHILKTAKNGKGGSISTVYTYLRPLRALYKKAINDGLISADAFPFGDGGFSIRGSQSARAALLPEEIKAFWNFIPVNDAQQRAKDYWFFSFFCFGIAPVDIAKLTVKNLRSDHLEFSRSNTSLSSSDIKVVTAPLREEMKQILNRTGNKDPKNYLFPVLRLGMKPKEQMEAIEEWKRLTNRVSNRIGVKLGTHKPINL